MKIILVDKNQAPVFTGETVKIACNYNHERNEQIGAIIIKYKGVKSEGYNFGEAEVNEYYDILINGQHWEEFTINNIKKVHLCNSIIKENVETEWNFLYHDEEEQFIKINNKATNV